MLKHRLLFGSIMIIVFVGLMLFDGSLDGSLTTDTSDDRALGGVIFSALIVLVLLLANIELGKLLKNIGMNLFWPVSFAVTSLIALSFYTLETMQIDMGVYLLGVFAVGMMLTFLVQNFRFGVQGTIKNIAAASFAFIYLGVFAAFAVGLRVRFGVWAMLMFVFVVKFTDIGAYTFGKLFGKHKFSPRISPNKTWEGMGGGVLFAVIVSICFAMACPAITIAVWQAVLFGVAFAFIGQAGDLAESMLKRDSQEKDSGSRIPGFGGILDVLDSPLVASVFAYMFFALVSGK